jgi:hypothetical protein
MGLASVLKKAVSKQRMKKSIRSSTGQKEPYDRKGKKLSRRAKAFNEAYKKREMKKGK